MSDTDRVSLGTAGPQPYTRRDWQFWMLLPLLAVMAAAGAAYQVGVNIKTKVSSA